MMIYSITNEQPFQVLSTNFSISPSESGYNLQISANGIDYTDFATVGAGVTRQFTGMANGNFYRLSGNTGTVEVNWMRECSPAGGGGTAGVSSLDGQTGALTTKTIGGQSILGTGDIPVGGGGDYMIVEDLSAITNPTDGMIAYVPAHTETLTGYTISNADGNLYGQVYLKHYNPREHSMMVYEQYDEGFISVTQGASAYGFGNDDVFRYIYRSQVALKYDDTNKLFTILYKPGRFQMQIGVSQEYYSETSGSVQVPAQMYIYKYGKWRLYEDGKISYYLNTISEAEYDEMYQDIPQMGEGEVQFIVDDYYYGWSTYRFKTVSSKFTNNSFYGHTFFCKASNGELMDDNNALSIRVGWSQNYKDWYFAKYNNFVGVQQTVTGGTKIGTVTVNGVGTDLYAPAGGGAAGVSSLDGQTGALTTKTIGGQSILGEGDIPVGGAAQYDLDAMTQAERAAFVAMCENLTELEREELFVYRDKSICRYDHTEGSGNSFKIGFFDYRQDGWSYPLTYFRHFFVKADGTYESLGNSSYPNIITYDTTYSDTAHTLSNSDKFSPLMPISNLNAESEGKVAINLRLIIQRSGPAKVVLSSKAWIERTGNLEGRICAEWHYSGNVITAVWNVVEHTATIASWTEVPEGGSGGPTIVNLDALSQAELVELYNTLSGTTSADTINGNYVFLKTFEGGDYGPYRLQMTGMPWGNRVRFASVITNPWNNSEITYLNAELQNDGSLSGNKSNLAVSLGTLKVLRDQTWTKYDFTTSAATCSGGATVATGDTCSDPWAFEIVNTKHYADGEFDNNINNMAPLFAFRITDTDSSDKRYSNPILHYDTITTVVLNDSDGNPHNFNYKFYFDYGDFVVTLLANEDEYRYARFTVTKR